MSGWTDETSTSWIQACSCLPVQGGADTRTSPLAIPIADATFDIDPAVLDRSDGPAMPTD